MRRTILLVAAMALTLLAASGVALAVNKIGTNGPDTLKGTNKADTLIGVGANDIILGLAGNDTLIGGPGKDVVNGGNLARPFGGNKNLAGGDGNDAVQGGLGPDNILAGDGNDYMVGGEFNGDPAAKDDLHGGAGGDVIVVFNKPAGEDLVSCGGGFERVWADRADAVAPDCERVFVGGGKSEAFFNSIPDSFWEGLHPIFS